MFINNIDDYTEPSSRHQENGKILHYTSTGVE